MPNYFVKVFQSCLILYSCLFGFFFSLVQWHYKRWENALFVKLQYDVKF